MKIIGITGGVGAGKSALLQYIGTQYKARIILADAVANQLKEPGKSCYGSLIELLGAGILKEDGWIDKKKMAQVIFADADKLKRVNELIHPAVKQYILEQIRLEKERGEVQYFFIEAALLIEENFEKIVDELWYVYADETVRSKRLEESRQYSKEKIQAIMKKQLSEQSFRKACCFVIDNSKELSDAYLQIDRHLAEMEKE